MCDMRYPSFPKSTHHPIISSWGNEEKWDIFYCETITFISAVAGLASPFPGLLLKN
jgi:hypothetical protein